MTVGDRNGVYSRYSACDWDASAKMQIKLADRETHRAQRLDKRSWEIVHGLEQRMRNRQCSNTKKLGVDSRVCSQARYTLPVFTGRVHGCSAWDYTRVYVLCRRPVIMGSVERHP